MNANSLNLSTSFSERGGACSQPYMRIGGGLPLSIMAGVPPTAFHEKAGECQACFSSFFSFFEGCFCSSLPPCEFLPLSQAAPVATLPSALFVERLSLGASWVYSFQ